MKMGIAGLVPVSLVLEPQVLRVSHQAVAVVMLEEALRDLREVAILQDLGIRIQDKEVGATPAGNPGNFSSQQTTGAGPASVPSNQPKPGNPPNQIIDFKSDNKAGQTRPPMGPPK